MSHIATRRQALVASLLALVLAVLAVAVLVTGDNSSRRSGPAGSAAPTAASTPVAPPVPAGRPNIVYVLTDDLSSDLVQYMPHVVAMGQAGRTFSNYFVTDSLCCPSRSSIFTGEFPHNSKVFTNTGPGGGESQFRRVGDQAKSFAVALHSSGYATALMGKYLNGYQPASRAVPPGWSEWDVAGNGYPEFNYRLTNNHTVKAYGNAPADYLTDVLSTRADSFITTSAAAHTPFFLEVASFAPHSPYVPDPRDADSFPGVQAPRTPDFNTPNTNPPAWLTKHPTLTPAQVAKIDADYRLRVQSVQAVDRLIAGLETTLQAAGVADDTYLVFNSDNGYHMGQHQLTEGKLTAFDSDIKVPLIVTGPGVAPGSVTSQLVSNIDLAPTFEQLAGRTPAATVDGHSLVGLLHGASVTDWRNAVLVEHHGPDFDVTDPDKPPPFAGDPQTYEALRTTTGTYVAYKNGQHEYYDLASDPYERDNVYASLAPARAEALQAELASLVACQGAASCWRAAGG